MFLREVFFSQIYHRKVQDACGRQIGIAEDVVVSLNGDCPQAVGICVSGRCFSISMLTGGLAAGVYRLKELTEYRLQESDWQIGKLLMDQQVIDCNRRRVSLVNDVVFASCGRGDDEQRCCWVGVDVGVRGIARRLRIEWAMRWKMNQFVSWRDIVMARRDVPSCLSLDHLTVVSGADVREICRKLGHCSRRMFLRQIAGGSVDTSQGEVRYD